MRPISTRLLVFLLFAATGPALAQDRGTLEDKPLPPLLHPDSPSTPAKELFGRKTKPDEAAPQAIGFYAGGCLAGGVALPIDGPAWQVMRLSRNRNWGHPQLVDFLERLAEKAKKVGWNGLLVGDMSQPRGGPMLTGHSSHQVGLDADIWFTPMPDHVQTREEREFTSAVQMVAEDRLRRRSQGVDAYPHRAFARRGAGPGGRAHLCQCRHQEGAVPRGRIGSRLARQGAAVVGARLPFPHPHLLPGGQSALQAATAARGGGRLRACARFLVQGIGVASGAAGDAAQAKAGDHACGIAGRMPSGAEGAVSLPSRLRRGGAEKRVLRSSDEEHQDAGENGDHGRIGPRFLLGRAHQDRQALGQDEGAV